MLPDSMAVVLPGTVEVITEIAAAGSNLGSLPFNPCWASNGCGLVRATAEAAGMGI